MTGNCPLGSGASCVTSNALADRHPAWSPDGTMIVFSRYSLQTEIKIVGIDGNPYSFPSGLAAYNPAWRPR